MVNKILLMVILSQQKYSNIVNYIITILSNWFLCENIFKCNLFLWCKAEFSASLLQSSVSHDPLEIIHADFGLGCCQLLLVLNY